MGVVSNQHIINIIFFIFVFFSKHNIGFTPHVLTGGFCIEEIKFITKEIMTSIFNTTLWILERKKSIII